MLSGTAPHRRWHGPTQDALFDWWGRRDRRQRFVLLNGTAAATGAYSHGAFTGQWDVGLPQTVLAWMHDAAASSDEPATPLILGGLVALTAAVVGGIVSATLSRWVAQLPRLCAALHWALVRVPVASAVTAILLYEA
ncbi:hypothetical protein [Streptomyces sp. MP131-18]|uniref:hypothetical protein n=1 Tax=Streptomyces sp. MP131-18 TaxID=1857892 RepID=UPI00097BBC7F|nr:hypothetical protein [Streptomyces sp. MP131-18]